ncbi:MAG: HAD family phosphatase [Patescibacteria group bacterium]|jgi:beta-phosphoglucomutase family hydrolase
MVKAVIFDMDGVISDTQKFHSKVESELLGRFGIVITPAQITERYAGVKTTEFFTDLLEKNGASFDLDELMKEKWVMMENLSKSHVDEITGSVSLIKMLTEMNIKLAVASASDTKYVISVLDKLAIRDYFEAVVTGQMVSRGKPDPEIFLLAAEKIGVDPKNCVVIEDGKSGMQAAAAAQMKSIGLVNDKNADYPTKNLVTTLPEITFGYINKLV